MAERVLISLEQAHLTFGGKPLFEGLDLYICEGDKICLIGKNGAGKTTLMRLITGELELDAGRRFTYPGVTIGYLAQQVKHNPDDSVLNFVLSGLPEEERNEDKQHLAEIAMAPLGLESGMIMQTLSGGQLRRAALARALITAPDLLLLDEPTNHLDLSAIEWLEGYLKAYRGAVVCVSHDRTFLKNISRKVFWVDKGIIRTSPSGYAQFDEWAEAIIEQEARELKNLQKKLAAEIDWTQGGVTGRRKRNQRRLGELGRLRDKLVNDKAAYNERMRRIETDLLSPAQASKVIVEFKEVSKSFKNDEKDVVILKDFHLRILRGDRIGILGKNGSGKSTFIKLLIGELEPDAGYIRRGKSMNITYFDQNRSDLNMEKTVWTTLCPDGGDYVFIGGDEKRPVHVCGYLKNFLFDPRIARDRISTLSGGQQNRLMLARILANPGNVLILDEPTNDLDMDTLDMLQEILADYQGTLLIVSHDRDFLDRTVTEVLAFEGNANVQGYMGGYSDYFAATHKPAVPAKKSATLTTVSARPEPASAPKAKFSGKEKHELEKLPERISSLSEEIEQLRLLLTDADLYTKDPEKFDKTSRRFAVAQGDLEKAETRWLELEERRQSLP